MNTTKAAKAKREAGARVAMRGIEDTRRKIAGSAKGLQEQAEAALRGPLNPMSYGYGRKIATQLREHLRNVARPGDKGMLLDVHSILIGEFGEKAMSGFRDHFDGPASAGSAKDLQKQAESSITNDPAVVDIYRAGRSARGVKLTRKQAIKEMVEREQARLAGEETKKREQAEKLREEVNYSARNEVAESLRGFVVVKDMLLAIERGEDPFGLEAVVNAEIIGAYFVKHASRLEIALYQLRAWEGEKYGRNKPEAVFADELSRIE